MITFSFDVFIGRNKPEKKTTIKCHDTGVSLHVFLKTEKKASKYRTTEEAYTIPAGATAVLKIEKPDKTFVLQDGKCQGSGVFFELPSQAFTAAGTASAEVNLFNKEGRRITSETFYIEVPEEVANDCTEDSQTYVSVMAAQIQAAIDAAKRAEDAAERAENAGGGGGDIDPEAIEVAVADYLQKNPISSGSTASIGVVELLAANWTGGGNLYSQVVVIDGVTENSQVDLTPSVEQLAIFYDKSLAFVAENEDGVVTIYAIGQKPENDYTMQVTITEVKV